MGNQNNQDVSKDLKSIFTSLNIFILKIRSNKKGWMTSKIFKEWLIKINNKFKFENRKVAMILDNCPSHIDNNMSNVKLFFLPAMTTSLIQPLDCGIIKIFKDFYRYTYFFIIENGMMMNDISHILIDKNIIKETTLLDAIIMAQICWEKVKRQTILDCFGHCFKTKGFFNKIKHIEFNVKTQIPNLIDFIVEKSKYEK